MRVSKEFELLYAYAVDAPFAFTLNEATIEEAVNRVVTRQGES